MKQEERKNVRAARSEGLLTPAVEETLRLYTAWLALLLRRQGTDEIRVPSDELRDALTGLSCHVSRENGEYVIRLNGNAAPAPEKGEDAP